MKKVPFRFKICGIRESSVLKPLAVAGGDAIGLNFFPRSVRYVTPIEGEVLAKQANRLGLMTVGLFVNESFQAITSVTEACGLDWVQLHGDESPDLALRLIEDGQQVIRAVRIPAGPIAHEQIEIAVSPWIETGCAILLDADVGASYGGQGIRLDWQGIHRWAQHRNSDAVRIPFVLAGGLDPANVRDAIVQSGASGVDVASGVEMPRGQKCLSLVLEWISQAIKGFEDQSNGSNR